MSLRTPNWFYTASRFVSVAAWRSALSGRLIWPALWVEPTRNPSLEVAISRWTLAWWDWRLQFDWGTWHPLDFQGPVDWERMGIDGYLAWAKKTFGRSWGRMEVDRLFRSDPAWKRLAIMGTAHNHYVRVALARAMLSAQDAVVGANAQVSAILEEENKSSDVQMEHWHKPGPGHSSQNEDPSLMAGLDKLGERLKRRTEESDDN